MLKNSADFEVSFLLNIFEQDTKIFVYKPFLPLNISDFSLVFFVKIATHLKKVTPSFPATPSQSWCPVKPHLFENLVGGSTPQQKGGWGGGGGGGAHYVSNTDWGCGDFFFPWTY